MSDAGDSAGGQLTADGRNNLLQCILRLVHCQQVAWLGWLLLRQTYHHTERGREGGRKREGEREREREEEREGVRERERGRGRERVS